MNDKNSRIAQQRKLLGLSQGELAERVKVSQKSISKYELGDRRPSYETLLAMSELFGVSTDYLLGKDTDDDTEQSESIYAAQEESKLLDIYRNYKEHGYSINLQTEILRIFPELATISNLLPIEQKVLHSFDGLTEDNQDIIIGKMKEMLKEQRYEDSVENGGLREAK